MRNLGSGGAEARVGLGAPAGRAGRRRARDGVAGAGGALQGLLRDHLLQGVLLLYLEDVWLLGLDVTDARREKDRGIIPQPQEAPPTSPFCSEASRTN